MDMSHTSNERDNRMTLKDQIELPSIDEGSCGGSFSGGGGGLKKGPWTSAEDAILVDYVKKHGEGNWNAVQKNSGLSRCGKSCRLRWANHLRPNLKKGAFTVDEEQLIIELHEKMGNKWARMAAYLPGRTDNEIKNYWNTRIKRRQRAGLPLYPPNMCFQPLNESQQSHGGSGFSTGDKQNDDFLQPSSFDIPDLDDFKPNQGTLSYMLPFTDLSINRMLNQGLESQNYDFITSTMKGVKRLREPETFFTNFRRSGTCGLPPFEQFSNGSSGKICRPFGLGFPYDPDPGSKNLTPLVGAVPGSHALPNSNLSTSQPLTGMVKLELPSLQYPDGDLCSLLMCPTTLEAVDVYATSPPTTVSMQSDCASPRNSGLLEALLQESQVMSTANKQLSEKRSNSSTAMQCDLMEGLALNLCNADWEAYSDPISPLDQYTTSIYSVCTPPTSGSSLDESSSGKTPAGMNIKLETIENVSTRDVEEREVSLRLDLSTRTEGLLDWSSDSSQDHTTVMDAIATLLGEDLCSESKHAPTGTSSAFCQDLEYLNTCPWNSMPPVCETSELS